MPELLHHLPRSTVSAVTDSLRIDIIHGSYKGGERLRQDAIASQFKVSQTIVREAFRQLVSEDLLVSEPRRGVFVPDLTADEADEITALRRLIEPQALAWSWPHMDDNVLIAAAGILDQIDAETETTKLIDLNNAFHLCLYQPSQKQKTLDLIVSLRRKFERYLRFTWTATDHISRSQEEHRRLLSLCAARKQKEAKALLRHHIEGTGALLAGKLKTQFS